MNGKELEALAKPILGIGWQAKLAKLIKCHRAHISRLATGVNTITDSTENHIRLALAEFIRESEKK